MKTINLSAIGTQIRKCRKNKKLTLQALSEKLGISRTGLWNIEQGHSLPRYPTFVKIKKVFPELDELN